MSRKPAGPEQAESIFRKAAPRVAYSDQAFFLYIFLATCIIINLPFCIHGQGIDGKIAAHHVFPQCGSIPDFFRPVAVRSVPFSPECRRLDGHPIDDKDNDTEGFSVDFYGMPVFLFCQGPDFFRTRRRRHIIIMRLPLHQQVPYGPADDIRFKTGVMESAQDAPYNWIQQIHLIFYTIRMSGPSFCTESCNILTEYLIIL